MRCLNFASDGETHGGRTTHVSTMLGAQLKYMRNIALLYADELKSSAIGSSMTAISMM